MQKALLSIVLLIAVANAGIYVGKGQASVNSTTLDTTVFGGQAFSGADGFVFGYNVLFLGGNPSASSSILVKDKTLSYLGMDFQFGYGLFDSLILYGLVGGAYMQTGSGGNDGATGLGYGAGAHFFLNRHFGLKSEYKIYNMNPVAPQGQISAIEKYQYRSIELDLIWYWEALFD